MKTALIFGVTGQDGYFLARQLLSSGYRVCGASRDSGGRIAERFLADPALAGLRTYSVSPNDFYSVFRIISDVARQRGAKSSGKAREGAVPQFSDPGRPMDKNSDPKRSLWVGGDFEVDPPIAKTTISAKRRLCHIAINSLKALPLTRIRIALGHG
jgi:hypothetical protein